MNDTAKHDKRSSQKSDDFSSVQFGSPTKLLYRESWYKYHCTDALQLARVLILESQNSTRPHRRCALRFRSRSRRPKKSQSMAELSKPSELGYNSCDAHLSSSSGTNVINLPQFPATAFSTNGLMPARTCGGMTFAQLLATMIWSSRSSKGSSH